MGVAGGDFNGDGKADLAVSANTGFVSVLLGDGTGSFASHVDYAAGGYTTRVAVGQLNGPGPVDIAAANADSDTVSVLLGNGNGTFAPAANPPAGEQPRDVAIRDLDGDGKPDLVVAHAGCCGDPSKSGLAVLMANGDGTFDPMVDYRVSGHPTSVAIADFDGDASPDLAAANIGTVSVLLGNGDGTFGTEQTHAAGSQPEAVAAADLNADGKADLAVGNSVSNTVSILLGDGAGGFSAGTEFPTGSFPWSLDVGDLNGDGKPDLVTSDLYTNDVSVLTGNGDGSFAAPSNIAVGGGEDAAIADLNGDGKKDLAATGSGGVAVLMNKNAARPATPAISGTDPVSPANANTPKVKGTVGTVGDPNQVWIFKTADCSGSAAATGTVAQFNGAGIPVLVADDSVTQLSAQAVDTLAVGANTSVCSNSITYTEVSSPPDPHFSGTPNPALTGDTVSFDASATAGLALVKWEWDLDGNGSFETDTGMTRTASRSYSQPQ